MYFLSKLLFGIFWLGSLLVLATGAVGFAATVAPASYADPWDVAGALVRIYFSIVYLMTAFLGAIVFVVSAVGYATVHNAENTGKVSKKLDEILSLLRSHAATTTTTGQSERKP
jgi:hypothetical protein